MRQRVFLMFLIMASGLTAFSVIALARPIDEKRPAAPDARVSIRNINGSVTVEGWDREELTVSGTLAEGAEDLEISGTKARIKIEVVYPRRMRNIRADSDLIVKVPRGSEVRVRCVNSTIEVSEVGGELELESVNGHITVSGDPESVDAQSVNGRIEIEASTARVDVQTVGGRIVLEGVHGEVAASTVGGSIRVSGGEFDRGDFSSISGDVEFEGALSKRGSFDFESHNGDIVLELPRDVSAEFEVTTFSGDIDNDFGPSGRSRRRFGPGREIFFSTGAGDARVSISSFSGDIRLLEK